MGAWKRDGIPPEGARTEIGGGAGRRKGDGGDVNSGQRGARASFRRRGLVRMAPRCATARPASAGEPTIEGDPGNGDF